MIGMRRMIWAVTMVGVLAATLGVARRSPAAPDRAPVPVPHCQPATPSTCGQVRIAGPAFFDQHGPWVMHGVQFFLPQYGINGRSFWDAEYQAAIADGSFDYWLDRASRYLHANTLRVFVDLPSERAGAPWVPTAYATLFDAASRADQRGMRLGISLHNSDDWALTPPRREWIEGMLSFFLQRDALPMIAYLNLDNEINNYCDSAHRIDCFVLGDAGYVDRALDWVRQSTQIIKARAPQVLLTVGMSTELATAGREGGAANFFQPDRQGDAIADLVDFLSPHNYAGRAGEIIAFIRARPYLGPVVLEEYGFPTDPFPTNPRWTEGPAACRQDPMRPECAETAPWYVEINIHALRTTSYAGGVAWMLADIQEKELPTACDGHSLPFDLWTGLFAVGGQYCANGTATRAYGAPKATAVRVCFYHTNSLSLCMRGED